MEKLESFTVKIGYPDKWKDYSTLTVQREEEGASYAGNVMAARTWNHEDVIAKMHDPVDKTEWGMTPQTVNAYYSPLNNEIVFPAAILQPPFFDFKADAPINYGGIGAVIGHEISHGFDDNGSRFDANGNMINWWTEADYAKFKAKTQQLIERYDSFTALDSVSLKGAMTIGENTADNGGIYIAYDAFKMTEQGQDTTKIDGYTPDQRYCLSIANIWRVKVRDEFMRTYVNTNSHSPAMWRVNGPLMNFDPFYASFPIVASDKNHKPQEERIKIW